MSSPSTKVRSKDIIYDEIVKLSKGRDKRYQTSAVYVLTYLLDNKSEELRHESQEAFHLEIQSLPQPKCLMVAIDDPLIAGISGVDIAAPGFMTGRIRRAIKGLVMDAIFFIVGALLAFFASELIRIGERELAAAASLAALSMMLIGMIRLIYQVILSNARWHKG